MKFKKKIKVGSGRIRTHNLRIWSHVDLPHDYSEKYNILELLTDIIAIEPRRLFLLLLGTYRLHTIHHEKIHIQCYNCNNLFMHKGQDQVNFEEVYIYI